MFAGCGLFAQVITVSAASMLTMNHLLDWHALLTCCAQKWDDLPAALDMFLDSAQYQHLPRKPLQFILQSSLQTHLEGVTGPQGVLYARGNLGIADTVQMPRPTVQLLAGMLLANEKHQRQTSQQHDANSGGAGPEAAEGISQAAHQLLRAIATSGWSLDRFAGRPITPLRQLSPTAMTKHAILSGELLKELLKVIDRKGVVDRNSSSGAVQQLRGAKLLQSSPFNRNQLWLVDPLLITVSKLAAEFEEDEEERDDDDLNADLERALPEAEGAVLEAITRLDLVDAIVTAVGLQGAAASAVMLPLCMVATNRVAEGPRHAWPAQTCVCAALCRPEGRALLVGRHRQGGD